MRSALRQQTVHVLLTGHLPTRMWFIAPIYHRPRSIIRFIAPKKIRLEIRSVNVIVNATTLHRIYLSTDPLLGHLILPVDSSIKINKIFAGEAAAGRASGGRHCAGGGATTPKMLRSPHLFCREPQIGPYTHEGGYVLDALLGVEQEPISF